jgi:hypothetical protein
MNAILSKDVLLQITALSLPPGKIGRKTVLEGDGRFRWYSATGPARCWKWPEPLQSIVHFPELVSAFGARAFAARWRKLPASIACTRSACGAFTISGGEANQPAHPAG